MDDAWVLIEQDAITGLQQASIKDVNMRYASALGVLLSKLTDKNKIFSLLEAERYKHENPGTWPASVAKGTLLKINICVKVRPEHQSLVQSIAPGDVKVTFSDQDECEFAFLESSEENSFWCGWRTYTDAIIWKHRAARIALDAHVCAISRDKWVEAFKKQKKSKNQNADIPIPFEIYEKIFNTCGVEQHEFAKYKFEEDYAIKISPMSMVAYRPAQLGLLQPIF